MKEKKKRNLKKNFPYSLLCIPIDGNGNALFFSLSVFLLSTKELLLLLQDIGEKRKLKINCQRRKNCIKRKDYYYYYFQRNLIMPGFP